ncbi:MAG: hypothetical protein ILA52_02000, partial [Alphaproteobacteria bacterium]|nr:hypothetical protein [Alphaproteobacteria bacterium]
NKFDIFINDMNEALSEVIQRCNIASSAQLEQLWQRVRRGEKWTLGKAILDASKNQSTFDAWVKERVSRDKVFRGSLLEFCSRYQNLLLLLEKHDRDRIFIKMIESGVFGKVYSIIAPLSEGIQEFAASSNERIVSSAAKENENDYTSVLKLATMNEPKVEETIINVDKNDNEELLSKEDLYSAPKPSFFSKLNPFAKSKDSYVEDDENDPFFQALHNSFQGRSEPEMSAGNDLKIEEPMLKSYGEPVSTIPEVEKSEPTLQNVSGFSNLQNTLHTLRATNEATEKYEQPSGLSAVKSEQKTVEDDEDLVYPFGGWTDEEHYNK